MILAASAVLLAMASVQEPPAGPPRRRLRNDVRILIEESPEGAYEHDYYEQPWPVVHETSAGNASSSVSYRTVCRPRQEEGTAVIVPPPVGVPLPLSLSLAVGAPRISVTSTSGIATSTVGGRTRRDPIISTKPALFGGGSGSGSETSSDVPYLYGPDLDLVVASDVTAWEPTRWMPSETSLRLYARALFGSFEVFDTPTTLQLYGVGPRLSIPLAKSATLEFAVTVSAGPAFLHTGIGDAFGFDGGVGIRVEHVVAGRFSFVAAAEANFYFSENVTAFGPVVNLGVNLTW